jgi:hypothetical protein
MFYNDAEVKMAQVYTHTLLGWCWDGTGMVLGWCWDGARMVME